MKITALFENDDDVGRLQGHYSDFHKDLHGFRPRHHSQDEWNDPGFLQQQIDMLHATMDKMKKTPEGRKALEDEGWVLDNNEQDASEGVAGPQKCWPGHRKVGTQPGTGKNKGKRVNDCEKIEEQPVADTTNAVVDEVYENPDEYHVLRHQTKDDIDREITMPAAWTKIKEFDSYQEAQNAYKEMKDKFPNQKFTVTSHSKKRRAERQKEWGLSESKGPAWTKYNQADVNEI